MLTCFSTLFYLWSKGYLDGSHTSSVYEVTQTIDGFKEDKSLEYISEAVAMGEVNRAVRKFDYFENKLRKVNRIIKDDSYANLEKGGIAIKDSFSKLLSISKTEDAFRVFHEKIKSFEKYVVQNNWQTLTRMSSRVIGRLASKKSASKNLEKTIEDTMRDLRIMRKVTLTSVLSPEEKQNILSRLDSLRVELELLGNYAITKKSFDEVQNSYKKSFEQWLSTLQPKLSSQKVEADRYGHYFLYLLVSLIFLSASLLGFGHLLQKKYETGLQASIEAKILEVNEKNLIEGKEFGDDFSYDFKNKFSKLGQYVHKRMRYGTIFQETLPFASVLLDKNLKVTWANQYFCDIWSISQDEVMNEQISWDYLAKYTNLGENDPVFEAVKNDVAGIYQIQAKAEGQQSFEPYEMYVSPVKYKGERSIQVYFYSLASLQDTIENQGRSIVGPITRTLEAMQNGQFDSKFQEQIRRDYEVANIVDIFEKFLRQYDYVTLQREGLLDEIDRLEDQISDTRKVIYDIVGFNSEIAQNNLELVKDLSIVRNKIIEMASISDNYKKLNQTMKSLLEKNMEQNRSSINKNTNLFDAFEEGLKSVPSVDKFKEELKVLKSEMTSLKNKISQSVDKLINSTTINIGSEINYKQSAIVDRIHTDLNTLSETIAVLDKKMVFLDVQFSKSTMIFDEHRKTILDNKADSEKSHYQRIYDEYKYQAKELEELEKRTDLVEDEIVSKLRSIYESYKMNTKAAISVKSLIDEKVNEDIDSEMGTEGSV